MSAMLIDNAAGIFTGLPGAAMRAAGQIRIKDGVIVEIGALELKPGEIRLDARGGVVYPGLISTHHHLFQSVLKGVQSGINLQLAGWLHAVPYRYWSKCDEETLAVAARIGPTSEEFFADIEIPERYIENWDKRAGFSKPTGFTSPLTDRDIEQVIKDLEQDMKPLTAAG